MNSDRNAGWIAISEGVYYNESVCWMENLGEGTFRRHGLATIVNIGEMHRMKTMNPPT